MGSFTSRLPLVKETLDGNPEDYYVHEIHYWPGKSTPFRLWHTLLPDYPGNSKDNDRPTTELSQNDSTLVNKEMHCSKKCLETITVDKNNKRDIDVICDNCKNKLNVTNGLNCDDIQLNVQTSPSDIVNSEINSSISTKVKPEDRWKHYKSYPFENVALSGGGMKGYAYIGAMKALEDAGVMPNIKRFAGSSAGAMCAAALAVGYSAQEICRCFFVDLNESITDQACCVICFVPKLYTRYGIHPAKKFFEGFGLVIAAKANGNVNLTFKELYEMNGKELCIVVCNITKMTAEYCHYTTTPDLSIREAVRMSIAVPIIFEPVTKIVDGQINYYIDGSTGDHFPMHCFDSTTVGPNFKEPENFKTLGFYVLSEKDAEHVLWNNTFGKEIPHKPSYMPDTKLARCQLKDEIKKRKKAQKDFNEKTFLRQLEKFSRVSLETLGMKHYEAPNKTHIDTHNILDYLVANLELLLNTQVVYKMKANDEQRTIPINVGYMETHNYDVEPADREFMLKQGYASAKAHLQQYMANDIKKKTELANKT